MLLAAGAAWPGDARCEDAQAPTANEVDHANKTRRSIGIPRHGPTVELGEPVLAARAEAAFGGVTFALGRANDGVDARWGRVSTVARGARDRRRRSLLGWLFFLVFGLGGAVAFVVGVVRAQAILLGPDATVGRVASAPTAAERAKGVVRGRATLVPATPKDLPACLVSHKKGKNTAWVTLRGDLTARVGDETLALPSSSSLEFLEHLRPTNAGLASSVFASVHQAMPQLAKSGGYKITCLGPEEPVWIEACRRGEDLVPCAGTKAVVLTVGGGAARADWERSYGVAFGVLALFGAVLFLRVVMVPFTYAREVVETLAVHGGRRPPGGDGVYWTVLMVNLLLLPISFAFWGSPIGPWITGGVVGGLVASFLVASARRLPRLLTARRVLRASRTAPLHTADPGARRELAVRVTTDAPTIVGPTGGQHAYLRCSLQEAYAERSGSKTVVRMRAAGSGMMPRAVPIEDDSGRGWLDLQHCILDSGDEPSVDLDAGNLPPWLPELLGRSVEAGPGHRHFTLTWKALDPGEPLLLYGGVERALPGAADAVVEARHGYREPATVPIVRGTPDARTVAYVGDELHLLGALRLELVARTAVTLLMLAAAAAWLAIAGLPPAL